MPFQWCILISVQTLKQVVSLDKHKHNHDTFFYFSIATEFIRNRMRIYWLKRLPYFFVKAKNNDVIRNLLLTSGKSQNTRESRRSKVNAKRTSRKSRQLFYDSEDESEEEKHSGTEDINYFVCF